MILLHIDPANPDPEALRQAARVLRGGGLVAFPTETVYGLGAHALDPAAVGRIYQAKGRPGYNPLIVHVEDADAARALASAWPDEAERLAAAFWPGPLTLVLPKHDSIPDSVTAGLPSVALRVPAHPVAHALLREAGIPVAAPSANRSTEVSPTTARHVARSLGERVDVIVDGGPCPVGIESTVLSLAGPRPTLLRPGSISVDDLRPVIGEVALPSAAPSATAARPSPGMLDRHYAPRATVRIVPPGERARMLAEAAAGVDEGRRVGGLMMMHADDPRIKPVIRMPDDPAGYASRLYAALHQLDDAGCDVILIDQPPDTPAWAGVRDRLRRAATEAP
ncbi:MAG TPA: L-threonylcarbamoyladenylate synthase [Longimicrobium sp.]|jgi:L-threonylcarbamoyladenylate synthase|uniref:L-threonylcarbamoyladenylate synthase n=1 Tax=Longimicrobium sp. TaxID=2029185 RepID=UPI002ED7D5E5